MTELPANGHDDAHYQPPIELVTDTNRGQGGPIHASNFNDSNGKRPFTRRQNNDRFINPIPIPKCTEYRQNLHALQSPCQNSIFFPRDKSPKSDLKKLVESPLIRLLSKKPKITRRMISRTPDTILDAPDGRDDFYTRLLDWSVKDVLAVALDKQAYLWTMVT